MGFIENEMNSHAREVARKHGLPADHQIIRHQETCRAGSQQKVYIFGAAI